MHVSPIRTFIPGVFLALLALALAWGALLLTEFGFRELQAVRAAQQIVPLDRVGAVLPGPTIVSGRAAGGGLITRAPHSGVPSLYYRYLHEVETRDSDGNKRWERRVDRAEAVDFMIADDSGSLRVAAQRDFTRIDFSLPRRREVVEGRNRYTEWRIEPGDTVLLIGGAQVTATGMVLGFRSQAGPPSVISAYGVNAERARLGRGGAIRLWAGLALLAASVYAAAAAIRLHRVLFFMAFLAATFALTTAHYAVRMTTSELTTGVRAQQAREAAAQVRFDRALERAGGTTAPLGSLPALDAPLFDPLPSDVRRTLAVTREAVEIERLRLQARFAAWPARWIAPLSDVARPTSESLVPRAAQAEIAARMRCVSSGHLFADWVSLAALGGLAAALAAALSFFWLGLRTVRTKRRMESVPTCQSLGAAFGLTELAGEIVVPEGDAALIAPLTSKPSIWFDYHVEEKRRVNNKDSWHTIERRTSPIAFLCRDAEGALRVDPDGAEIVTRHRDRRHDGKLRYTERRLEVGDPVYVLGPAVVHGEAADALCVLRDDSDEPFIVANLPEAVLLLRKGMKGLAWLTLATTLMTLSALLVLAALGEFGPADLMLAALAAPLGLFGIAVVMHYNDLLFLRERARRNWSNVQVSLRKRRNLVRPLNALVSRYLSHEGELQTQLATLRTEMRTAADSPDAAGRYLDAEQALAATFRAVVEDHPQLAGARAVEQLTQTLTKLENEIALLRTGYDAAVERYNARLSTFPDVLIARVGNFEAMSYFGIRAHDATR